MPRYQNPADINFYQGQPTPNGKLFFFESGTSTPKQTYADVGETIPNAHPVLLDASGREPNIFYSGSAKVVLQNELGEQVWERDPVGGESQLGNFSDYNLEIIYGENDIVKDDGEFYISLTNNNVGNKPSESPDDWLLIYFNYPTKQNESSSQLSNRMVNILKDSTTFKLPDTTNVKVGDLTFCSLPSVFATEQPTIEVFNLSTDTIVAKDVTDTDLKMDVGAKAIGFEYTGSGVWRLLL